MKKRKPRKPNKIVVGMRAAVAHAKRRKEFADGIKHAAKQVPTNWCDSLLTGPNGIGDPPYGCRTIEKLLRGVQDRIRSLVDTKEPTR